MTGLRVRRFCATMFQQHCGNRKKESEDGWNEKDAFKMWVQRRYIGDGLVWCGTSSTGNSLAVMAAETAEAVNNYCEVVSEMQEIVSAGVYTWTMQVKENYFWKVEDGQDVTGWFVTETGQPAFLDQTGVAVAAVIDDRNVSITVDTTKLTGFTVNGPHALALLPAGSVVNENGRTNGISLTPCAAGTVEVPAFTMEGRIYGSADSQGNSTVKRENGLEVEYSENTAVLKLEMEGLEDAVIDSSKATVRITDGDGYYADELILGPTVVAESWTDGSTEYQFATGDLEWNTGDYEVDNGGREWSCFGGDGVGNYNIMLEFSGITYNGLPVASQQFPVEVFIYGREATGRAATMFSGVAPRWSFAGTEEKPVLCDPYRDVFLIDWPVQVDASGLELSDFTVKLESEYGDIYEMTPGEEYVLTKTQAGQTELTLTYQNWSYTPVYTKMTVEISHDAKLSYTDEYYHVEGLSHTWDIASVFVYLVQQGGGMDRNGTVVCYSVYGIEDLSDWTNVFTEVTYVLSCTDENGEKCYYAEDTQGKGTLTSDMTEAAVFDGSGEKDRNVQVVNHSVYITRRENAEETKDADGRSITFTKEYSGGSMKLPENGNVELEPGFVFGNGYLDHEMWGWQECIGLGWKAEK